MKKLLASILKVAGIIAFIAALAITVAVLLGFLRIEFVSPGAVSRTNTAVCTNDDIQRHNELVKNFAYTDEERADKASKVQSLADELLTRSGANNDASCAFIAYAGAVNSENTEVAKKWFERVESLASKGVFPSNKILDLTSIDSMRERVKALENPEQLNTDPRGSG